MSDYEDEMDVDAPKDLQFSSENASGKKRTVADLPVEAQDNLPWVEKYRPSSLDDVSGHQDILATINRFVETNRLPHLLLYGPPGTGKTSTILALARRIYGTKNMRQMVLELNASDDRGIDVVREQIKTFASTKQIFNMAPQGTAGSPLAGYKLIILDEADAMTSTAQMALRRIMERYTANTRFCVIANYTHKLSPALLSRCTRFRFSPLKEVDIRTLVDKVIEKEGVKIQPDAVDSLVTLSRGDMRRALNVLQACFASSIPLPMRDAPKAPRPEPETVTNATIYDCIAAPHPSDIQEIMSTILSTSDVTSCLNTVQTLKSSKGLALADILSALADQLQQLEVPAQTRITWLEGLAEIEWRLSGGGSEAIQTGGLVGVVRNGSYPEEFTGFAAFQLIPYFNMRYAIQGILLASLSVVDAERVLGAYIFARHGDRTPKIFGSTQLTDLGYREVFDSGSFYNERYISSDSPKQIEGISADIVNPKQISASAPSDAVLQNSATGFLQGVYPPVGKVASQTLGNGSSVESPLNGYQLIQLTPATTSKNAEDSTWLQGSSGCQKATVSSDNYFSSEMYTSLLSSTKEFYQSLSPMLDGAFVSSDMTFKNAYTIFDYLNVGKIHNSTSQFPHKSDLTDEVYHQLIALAGTHEFNLAYNSSDKVRAIDGAVLAGEILAGLNETIATKGKSKLNIGFGSYGTIFALFGLMQMPAASVDFTGIPDYASSMVFELVTNASGTDFPDKSDLSVRFMFHNGTITGSSEPTVYPLYGQSSKLLSWDDFASKTKEIAVTSDEEWCTMCGNTDGKCASSDRSSGSGSVSTSSTNGSGMSLVVAGVIGAMVTLAVILGLQAIFFLLGGFRIAKRNKASHETMSSLAGVEEKKV
ncbi:ATPase, AAA-type, core [Penicillium griseofulvum]|uniref:ATPase, AAA-type, core n=1 Tax=Penicillium patulum TaxID=5078 RepID=A0A135LR85_PENPA|nr:ATPase, AAA-type, core [Penicillium griseofulvum]KXG51476.1 ATPase, AAA-type, core [Penicillium griseofulvum]